MEGKRSSRPDESNKNKSGCCGTPDNKEMKPSISSAITCTGKNVIYERNTIIYTNADCLSNKLTDLKVFIEQLNYKPVVIVITEVNPKVASCLRGLSEYNIDGYNLHGLNIGVKGFRGILVYSDKNVSVTTLDLNNGFTECLLLSIAGDGFSINLGVIYRSPSSDKVNDDALLDVINKMCKLSGSFILLGDFNLPNITWSNCLTSSGPNSTEQLFLSSVLENFLTQHVKTSTRKRGQNTPSLLDLVLTRDECIYDVTCLSPLGKSDHAVLEIQLNSKRAASFTSNVCKYNYSKGDYSGLREFLARP